MPQFIISNDRERREAVRKLVDSPETDWPLRVTITKYSHSHSAAQLDKLGGMLRDIARWKIGNPEVSDFQYENVVDDFKRTDIWPRYAASDADIFSGEVVYRPKSRRDLRSDEISGILSWLEFFMAEHCVPIQAAEDKGDSEE